MKKKRRRELRQELSQAAPVIEKKPTISLSRENVLKFIGMCLLVFIVSFMAYANTLKADFIWDDEYLILNNSQVKSFTHLQYIKCSVYIV